MSQSKKYIKVPVAPSIYKAVKELASQYGMSVPAFLRHLLIKEIEDKQMVGVSLSQKEKEAVKAGGQVEGEKSKEKAAVSASPTKSKKSGVVVTKSAKNLDEKLASIQDLKTFLSK